MKLTIAELKQEIAALRAEAVTNNKVIEAGHMLISELNSIIASNAEVIDALRAESVGPWVLFDSAPTTTFRWCGHHGNDWRRALSEAKQFQTKAAAEEQLAPFVAFYPCMRVVPLSEALIIETSE